MHKHITHLILIMGREKWLLKLFDVLLFLYVIQNKIVYPNILEFPGKFEIWETGSWEICVRNISNPNGNRLEMQFPSPRVLENCIPVFFVVT